MLSRLFAWLKPAPTADPPPEEITWLLECLQKPDPIVRRHAEVRVCRMLYNNQRDYSNAFVIALMQAVAQISPQRMQRIPHTVEMLAMSGSSYAGDMQVERAAQSCLDSWQVYRQKAEQADTLLRGAQNPAEPETLLRPAEGAPSSPPDELLRAAEPNEKPQAE